MKFKYPIKSTQQGRDEQQEAQRRPANFGSLNGSPKISQTTKLDDAQEHVTAKNRVRRYMEDETNRRFTDSFMDAFEKSNQGQEFLQARYNLGAQPGEFGAFE